MDRLRQRIAAAVKALSTLKEVLEIASPSKIVRDAAIQRFGYTFEAVWKAAKHYLLEVEGLDIGSPKGVIRACMSVGLLSEEETVLALEMVNDRNQTVHTYNEALADAIFCRVNQYAELMDKWVKEIQSKTSVQ